MNRSKFNLAAQQSPEDSEPPQIQKAKPKKKKPTLADGSVANEELEAENEYGSEAASEERIEEENVVHFEPVVLKRADVRSSLSMLGKTAEGDGYTYLKASCTGMNLTEISSLTLFKYLQCVDVSKNNLQTKDLQVLGELQYLVFIQADNNAIASASLPRMKYLQVIVMNYNNINSVFDIYQPELSTLELGYNKLVKITFQNRMPMLRCLDFRYNSIHDLTDFNYEMLDSLYLAGNKIRNLIGISQMVNLRVLHLRNNPIKLLTGFDENMKKLTYLNLRNCKVATMIQLKKLRVLPSINTLVMKGCPLMGGTGKEGEQEEEDDADLRVEMAAALPKLKRINKTPITPEEYEQAKDMIMQWLEGGENDEEEAVTEEGVEGEEKPKGGF